MPRQKEEEAEIEDANHVLLYKSPGRHSGGGDKTYDLSHAKDEEEAADLEADGWFHTLDEAYADAGVKLKRGGAKAKGKSSPAEKAAAPPKAAKAEQDPITGDAPTAADVQTAFKALKAAKDMATVTAVLKKFNAVKAADLTEDQYPAAIAAAEKAAAK